MPDPAKPARRTRHDGWTEERKAALIAALGGRGTIAEIAEIAAPVGMSRRSVYRLRSRPDGAAVAAAWCAAAPIPRGFFDDILDRADARDAAKMTMLSGVGLRRELRAEMRRARRRAWAAARRAKARQNPVAP